MIMALPLLLAMVPQSVPQPDGCWPIQEDRIYARDVAAAIPAFSNIAAEFALGYAPAPGIRRVFKGEALERLARNQGVAAEALPDVCFERAMATLEAGEILGAMRASWSGADVRMELRSFGPQIAPQGKVVFPRTGLQLPASSDPQAEVIWRGYVAYGLASPPPPRASWPWPIFPWAIRCVRIKSAWKASTVSPWTIVPRGT